MMAIYRVWLPVLAAFSVSMWIVLRQVRQIKRRWLRLSIQFIPSVSLIVSFLLLMLLGLLQLGCSKTLITSRAPNHSATVRVREFCTFPDCVVEVTVQTGWWAEKSLVNKSDCIVNFAHVAWTQDSRVAAIFVDNGSCASIHEGYDLKAASLVPFAPVADIVRRSIIAEYGVGPGDLAPYGDDVLEWAHYPGDGIARPGPHAFRDKYHP
jgi:hypothetical protein